MTIKRVDLNGTARQSASIKGWVVSVNGCPAAYASVVLNGEDVQVMGQTRGACICLAVAQKYLAFHTTPPGTLVSLSQNFMKNRGREGTGKDRMAGGAVELGVGG